MVKYLLVFTLFFMVKINSFSQTKSSKYPHKKSVTIPKKINSSPTKVPATNPKSKFGTLEKPKPKVVSKSPSDTSKVAENKVVIDSTRITKPKPDSETKQKPITGPISGPSSFANQTQKNNEKLTLKSKPNAKHKSFLHKPVNWIKGNVDIGVKLCGNFSTLTNFAELVYSGANIPDEKPLPGFSGGIILGIKSKNNISFAPEILISQQGSQITESMNKFKFRINYLRVPLLLKVKLGKKKLTYFVEGGGYFCYAISKKSEREIGGKIYTDKLDFETKYDVFGKKDNRFDYGTAIGIGANFGFVRSSLSIGSRYEHGFSNLIVYKGEQSLGNSNSGKNRVLSASISYFYLF